ncbi:hypothetical protein ACFLSJ_03125, partial [Verrucomicrobiota bacterium]
LDSLRPDAILVPTDNHAPMVDVVLAARRRGTATIMLQHGLDCEHLVLDDAFASHVAVWGAERATRYTTRSACQPMAMAVVGNAHYDKKAPPDALDSSGDYWLWVTRPHVPGKCYLPSRWPDEGLRILDALLSALGRDSRHRLRIRAHPFDYAFLYAERIRQAGLQDRAEVCDDSLWNLFPGARLVISEDSTAGMDAMMAGKVLVQSHLAESSPVMPFADRGAALPGLSSEMLADSLTRAERFGSGEHSRMWKAQRGFLHDFAGSLDGRAAERFAAFVKAVLEDG